MLSFLLETELKSSFQPDLAENLAGKSMLITLLPFEKSWKIVFSRHDINVNAINGPCPYSFHPDLQISATPRALFALLSRGERSGLHLEGDVVLAQKLERCCF